MNDEYRIEFFDGSDGEEKANTIAMVLLADFMYMERVSGAFQISSVISSRHFLTAATVTNLVHTLPPPSLVNSSPPSLSNAPSLSLPSHTCTRAHAHPQDMGLFTLTREDGAVACKSTCCLGTCFGCILPCMFKVPGRAQARTTHYHHHHHHHYKHHYHRHHHHCHRYHHHCHRCHLA